MTRITVTFVLILCFLAVTSVLAQRRGPKVPEGVTVHRRYRLCYRWTRTPETRSLYTERRRKPTAHYLGAWRCLARWQ